MYTPTHQDVYSCAGEDDGEAAEVGVRDDGSGNGHQVEGAADDVGDLRRVDALHVVLLEQVQQQVAGRPVDGQPQPQHAPLFHSYVQAAKHKYS